MLYVYKDDQDIYNFVYICNSFKSGFGLKLQQIIFFSYKKALSTLKCIYLHIFLYINFCSHLKIHSDLQAERPLRGDYEVIFKKQ